MSSEKLTDSEIAAVRAEVLELSAAVVSAAERVDAEATFSRHSTDPDASHINMGRLNDRETLLAMYRDLYAAARTQVIDFGEPVVSVLSRTSAVVATSGGFEAHTKDGKRIRSEAAWTWVWTKRDGAWQLLHSHQSFPAPPAPE